jgi:hypothetical protein
MLVTAPPSPGVPVFAGLERYFEITLYLMVLAGFATLASTGTLDIPTLLLVSTALLFRGYLVATRRKLMIPEGWTNLLTVCYLAFYLADYLFLSGLFLNATVHLVLFVMLVRLYSARRDRDYYFLAVLAFLMVLAAAVLTVDSVFLAAFAGFILMAVATFILMEMRHASANASIQSQNSADQKANRRMAITLAGAAPVIVLLILLGAAAIFFVLPRVSAGYLSSYASRNQLATGFSDRVELGQIGEIQQSRSVAMHVQIEGDKTGRSNLKLRGVALSLFDGRVWYNPGEQHVVPRSLDGRFALRPVDVKSPAASKPEAVLSIHYIVLMEPVGSNVFFLALAPETLQGSYRHVSIDSGGAVFDLDSEHPVGRYEAWSNIARPEAADLRAAAGPYPPGILPDYVRFPDLDPRIPRLAAQITASSKNNYDKAAAIETYLLTHFGYTLQLSRTPPRDPLSEFLFVRKQGHCEYFASSMAVMLRTLGIPARVVNGFHMTEFNDLTSEYVVRDSDAHSWVEAYFQGYGWVSFDPTPAGPDQAHTGWSRMLLYVDAMQSFWREWIVNYDTGHQVALGENTVRSTRHWFFRWRNRETRQYQVLLAAIRRAQLFLAALPARWIVAGALATFLLVILGNTRRIWHAVRRNRLASHPEKAPRLAAEIWYERMLATLARRGWRKPASQTPGEFVGGIDDETVREQVARFTLHYEWARFGDSADHARRLPELHDGIATSARR